MERRSKPRSTPSINKRRAEDRQDEEEGARQGSVLHRLNARLRVQVNSTRATSSKALRVKLPPVLRQAMPWHIEWANQVPPLRVLAALPIGQALQAKHAIILYRLLRLFWLAELVFGDTAAARAWLASPKTQLHASTPLSLLDSARAIGRMERWLLNIDEGNGP